jgi:uncharacterized membrane protein YbhN (UPF0104 family)
VKLKLLLGLAVVVAVVVHVGTGPVLEGLRALSPTTLAAALALGLLTTAASAARWAVVARGLGLSLPLGTAIADCYRAQFLNSVLPAGVLGDVHRALDHGRRSHDLTRGAHAVVLERLAGQTVVIALSALGLALLPSPVHRLLTDLTGHLTAHLPTLAAATLITLAVLLGLAGLPRLRRPLTRLATGIRAGLLTARTGPAVLACSVLAMAGHLGMLALAAEAVGVHTDPTRLLPLLLVSLLAMGLPLNIGGWGPREAATATGFGLAGLGAATGLATAVAFGVLALVSTLPGLGVLVLRRTAQQRTAAPTNSSRTTFRAHRASVA